MNIVLEVKNLTKHYSNIKAVNGVSFSIEKGTCLGLLGPNGAGKTTTIEVIEGIRPPTSGDILYKGKPRDAHFRKEVGIQFQNTELPVFLSVLETLETFRNLYGRKSDITELIEICQLQSILLQDNRKISGGQKQRLLLAMALANDPELIFLDEPTTGLDPQSRRHLWDIVHQIKAKQKTVILTTHYMEEAQILCDRVAIMDYGKIIADGPPDKLLKEQCNSTSIILSEPPDEIILDRVADRWTKIQDGVEIHTDDLNQSIKNLLDNGVDLSAMIVRPQNLEDLFLKLTGKKLRA
ncbi:MAG: ABC transporter ATP-binding protein [Desulfobacteraceae bacterium]|nr:MAG: ABC transporter ATP-binding protein [Desulfobacteraceae bacterium]